MPQDAFTLRYLCSELNRIFKGGKVNRIVQTDEDKVVFTVYTAEKRTEKLLLDVNPAAPRIGIAKSEGDSPLTAPNFCMLLRKHLSSATIDGIELVGFDRIVKIDFTASAEFFDAVRKTVYVELMGRYSNVILTESGKILGGNRGINMLGDFVRPLIVGKPYVFPPAQNKKLPSDSALTEYFSSCDGNDDLTRCIISVTQGLALDTAKEIVASFKGDVKTQPESFFKHFNDFIYKSVPKPCVLTENGCVKDVFVFPYSIADGEYIYFDALWKAEEYYHSEKNKFKRYKNLKDRLFGVVNTALKKAKKRLQAITAKEKDAATLEENRIKGELIIANIYRIKRGDLFAELENYYDGGVLKISLDSGLSPSENAESYYKKYNKQKRALVALAPQKEQAESELNYLVSVIDEITLAETESELKAVRDELKEYGLIREEKIAKHKKAPESSCRVYDVYGYSVKVGRNNTENDKLTASAKGDSLWLHAKDYHSSHVIVESDGKEISEKIIIAAAEICAYYSKSRDGGKCEIVYAYKRTVKKPPRSKPGFVTYTDYRSVTVLPNKHAEFLKTE